MHVLDIYRKSLRNFGMRSIGESPNEPRLFVGQLYAQKARTRIRSLPTSPLKTTQDLDPNSPTFGYTYFVAGLDTPGDPYHPPHP